MRTLVFAKDTRSKEELVACSASCVGEGLFSLYNLHLLEVQPLPRYIAMESGDNLFTFLIEERKILKSRSQVSPAHSKILFRG